MIAEERRSKILDALHARGALSVNDACGILNVSRMTVHRDLEALSEAGMLRKVHGGAVIIDAANGVDAARSFTERKPVNAAAKAQIAQHLADVLAGARTLALDASSTVFEICHTLPAAPAGQSMFVITNGIPHFEALRRRDAGFHVAITGGELHPRTESLVGPLALKTLDGMRFDFAVVSAAGLMEDTKELYDGTPEGAAMKLAFLHRATKKVLAIDKSKFNQLAPYPLGVLGDFDLMVTEDGVKELRKSREKSRAERRNKM